MTVMVVLGLEIDRLQTAEGTCQDLTECWMYDLRPHELGVSLGVGVHHVDHLLNQHGRLGSHCSSPEYASCGIFHDDLGEGLLVRVGKAHRRVEVLAHTDHDLPANL